MRKVERLVNLTALLLDTPRPLTLDEVAEMVPGYEASGESLRRMFERDKEELRGLGVPVRADLAGGSPLVAALLEAVTNRKRIAFTYQPPGRGPAERRLQPYALVHRRGTWYVVGHDLDRDAQRSFRLSRIRSDVRKLRPTARGPDFEVPEGFDPGQALPTAGEHGEAEIALVKAGRAAARMAELRGAEPVEPVAPDGRVTLKLPVVDRGGFLAWALGNDVEVVEPTELRAEVLRRLARLEALVGDAPA